MHLKVCCPLHEDTSLLMEDSVCAFKKEKTEGYICNKYI